MSVLATCVGKTTEAFLIRVVRDMGDSRVEHVTPDTLGPNFKANASGHGWLCQRLTALLEKNCYASSYDDRGWIWQVFSRTVVTPFLTQVDRIWQYNLQKQMPCGIRAYLISVWRFFVGFARNSRRHERQMFVGHRLALKSILWCKIIAWRRGDAKTSKKNDETRVPNGTAAVRVANQIFCECKHRVERKIDWPTLSKKGLM